MGSARILVVEDNHTLALGLCNNLKFEGYHVLHAADGAAALDQVKSFQPDAVILDLMLPKINGYDVLRTLRDDGSTIPVLILTARGDEVDKVRGFRLGADQYLTKPFSVVELMARIEALLRRVDATGGRPGGESTHQVYRFESVVVDADSRAITRDGKPVSLTPRAFDLLLALLRRNGAVASRQELLREVWRYEDTVVSRTVDAHVAELRRKLEANPAEPRLIVTVWKRGYRMGIDASG
jgi:two-component system alkaline phosphatase synthesis response regulator PhoP